MDLTDTKALRRNILQVTLDEIDGREGGRWFVGGFLQHFKLEPTEENARIIAREIAYLAERRKLKGNRGGWHVRGHWHYCGWPR
jgi:hypothetical protein